MACKSHFEIRLIPVEMLQQPNEGVEGFSLMCSICLVFMGMAFSFAV